MQAGTEDIMSVTKTVLGVGTMAVMLLAGSNAMAQQSGRDAENTLARRSAEATTVGEHAAMAREYRQRAEAFERTASTHEANAARKAAQPRFPFEGKQVAHIRDNGDRERQLAAQARRAAEDAYARADQHVRQVVERQLAE